MHSNSFTENGDGTVKDNASGLLWQKCIMGRTGVNCTSGSITGYTWADAITQCNNSTLAGKTWRLPNTNELNSILNPNGMTNLFINPVCVNNIASFWSSTTYIAGTTQESILQEHLIPMIRL